MNPLGPRFNTGTPPQFQESSNLRTELSNLISFESYITHQFCHCSLTSFPERSSFSSCFIWVLVLSCSSSCQRIQWLYSYWFNRNLIGMVFYLWLTWNDHARVLALAPPLARHEADISPMEMETQSQRNTKFCQQYWPPCRVFRYDKISNITISNYQETDFFIIRAWISVFVKFAIHCLRALI